MSRALLNGRVEEHSLAAGNSSSQEQEAAAAAAVEVDSDFVVILASLLCALICVLGLIAVARCAWVRRLSSSEQEQAPREGRNWNKGLKKKALRSLPKETCSDEKAGGECAICLTELRSGEQIRVLPHCSHPFHLPCIDTWLASHSSCPSCRHLLPPPPRCHMCGAIPSTSTPTAPPPPPPPQAASKDPQNHHPNTFLP